MAEPDKLRETAVAYGAMTADLKEPVILEKEGKPVAVILSFEEYRRLQQVAASEEQRRQDAWRRLNKLLAEVHSRTSQYSSEEIEAEITAAYNEVRELRYGHRRSN